MRTKLFYTIKEIFDIQECPDFPEIDKRYLVERYWVNFKTKNKKFVKKLLKSKKIISFSNWFKLTCRFGEEFAKKYYNNYTLLPKNFFKKKYKKLFNCVYQIFNYKEYFEIRLIFIQHRFEDQAIDLLMSLGSFQRLF